MKMFTFTTIRSLGRIIRQEKEIKSIQIGKETVRLSQFADKIILHIKTQRLHQNLLELINTHSKLAGKQNKNIKISSITIY
jgi:chromosome condensin MukBEF ATPase and DNA-binding subunit MukB